MAKSGGLNRKTHLQTGYKFLYQVNPSSLEKLRILPDKVYRAVSNSVTEEGCRKVYKNLENHHRVERNIIATYEAIFRFFGITIDISVENQNTLIKVNAIRNCIMHRGGIIDQKACAESPSLAPFLGKLFEVREKDFSVYYDAISAWVLALLDSVSKASPSTENP